MGEDNTYNALKTRALSSTSFPTSNHDNHGCTALTTLVRAGRATVAWGMRQPGSEKSVLDDVQGKWRGHFPYLANGASS